VFLISQYGYARRFVETPGRSPRETLDAVDGASWRLGHEGGQRRELAHPRIDQLVDCPSNKWASEFFQGRCVRRVTTYKRTPLHSAALKHMVGCVSRICKMAALGLATGSLQVWRRSCGDSRGQKSDQEFGSVFWTIPLKDCTITHFGNAAPNQAAATRRYRRSPSLISETYCGGGRMVGAAAWLMIVHSIQCQRVTVALGGDKLRWLPL
jgi:hypothetical protein